MWILIAFVILCVVAGFMGGGDSSPSGSGGNSTRGGSGCPRHTETFCGINYRYG